MSCRGICIIHSHTHAHTALPYICVTLRLWHMWHASLNWVRSIAFPASQTICQSTELTYCQSIVHMQRLDAKETKPSRDQTRPRKVATRYRWRSATHTHTSILDIHDEPMMLDWDSQSGSSTESIWVSRASIWSGIEWREKCCWAH